MTTILCVEDERFLREDICEELQDAGYDILEANDGQEGLDKILNCKPDLVLSDITMPHMSGSELVIRLRGDHPQFAHMPVIFLSALADRNDVLDGVKLGADDYLTKPIDYEMLITKIESALRQADRMLKKKEDEQVKLFNSLTKGEQGGDIEPRKPIMPPRNIVMVGRSDNGFWKTQRFLEGIGHNVQVFTSGRAYLNKLEDGKLDCDLVMLWFHTDDMQAIMIPRMATEKLDKYVLVVPEELNAPATSGDVRGFLGTITLPVEEDDLIEKIKLWTQ